MTEMKKVGVQYDLKFTGGYIEVEIPADTPFDQELKAAWNVLEGTVPTIDLVEGCTDAPETEVFEVETLETA